MRLLPPLLLLAFLALPPTRAEELSPAALQQRGHDHFFAGRFAEAIADYDQYLIIVPNRAPHHWQRGLALYYAEEYDKGVAQFESHQTVNRHDVENAVWHFLCVVRGKDGSVEKARKNFIPITGDTRVPLKEVHALFAGTGTVDAVLAAAKANAEGLRLRNQLCYAHLYLGLYFEALGDKNTSAKHMKKAAVDYKMDHFMGKVAQVHHTTRSK
jgi:lipoprotein NlpI